MGFVLRNQFAGTRKEERKRRGHGRERDAWSHLARRAGAGPACSSGRAVRHRHGVPDPCPPEPLAGFVAPPRQPTPPPLLSPVPELTDPRPATRAALEQLRLRGGSDVDAGPLPTPDSKRLKDMAKCSGYACSSLYALSALPPRRRLRVRSSCARMPHPRARACRHGSKHARDPARQCAKHGYTHGFAHTACSPPRTRTHAPHADMQEAPGRASDRRGPD